MKRHEPQLGPLSPRFRAPRIRKSNRAPRYGKRGREHGRSPGLPDRSPFGPSQARRPVDLPNFVPGYSGGGRAGVTPASLCELFAGSGEKAA
jgi:hypothetical protein